MLDLLEEKALILARQRPPGLFFFRRNFRFRNFGDELSPALVAAILRSNYPQAKWHLGANSKKMLAIGSIMHFAENSDVIWGTGVNGKAARSSYRFSSLDVRAVRGPRTRGVLYDMGIDCPAVYGDPALLVPKFLKIPRPQNNVRNFIVIPHYNDQDAFEGVDNLVSPLQSYREVIRQILSARKVISSSLHGIILAEAYGIPAVLVLPNPDEEKRFKYLDYYEGTGRHDMPIADSFDEALRLKGGGLPTDYSVNPLEDVFPSDFYTG
ncbi:polysaccharide pyruvyl transferase family protein [Marinobacter sp.]|uniref:polysaccharide pyruvyl transferase family protein n=1 Tax=Marinobacter sp. TaxID=50741 RepID=UPI0034A33F8A